jgi:hypothetical protein
VIAATIPKHGLYRLTSGRLDLAIRRYLPASSNELLNLVMRRAPEMGMDPEGFNDLRTVSECLFILAEWDGHGLD